MGLGRRSSRRQSKPGFREPMLQRRAAVVAPERLAAEDEEWHAEDVIGGCLLLAAFVGEAAFARQIVEIFLAGKIQTVQQPGYRVGLIGLEFAQEELFEREPPVIEQSAMLLRKQYPNRGKRGVVNLQASAAPQ